MYQRHTTQISMFDSPELFGTIPLNPKNEWVRLSKLVPWMEFEARYEENFKSKTGQPACSARMALGSLLIKERYRFSDEDIVAEITMNPYLQYFIGLHEFQYETPFDPSMMTRFRQRITPEMLDWVNDRIIGRPESNDNDTPADGSGGGVAVNKGTIILDATCAPQNIRFPTDASLLNEARENAEEIIDILHENSYTDGKKPRTYRVLARNAYNGFSKNRKKTHKSIRNMIRKQLGYLRRDLAAIREIEEKHPGCLEKALPKRKMERLLVLRTLYEQQNAMYQTHTHRVDNRIVSLHQPWVRPIVRGKQNADVEFGSKVEMSVVDGFLRVEDMRWDAFNESTTLKTSVESFRKAYGHYPERVLADTIFRTRENLRYCREHGIHLSGPKLGKPPADAAEYRRQLKQEWLESGERGEIERDFGVGKRRYSLGCIMTKLKHTSEVAVRLVVLTMNLQKRLRLLFAHFSVVRLWEKIHHFLTAQLGPCCHFVCLLPLCS